MTDFQKHGEIKQTVSTSENIDVSLTNGQSLNGISDPTMANKTKDLNIEMTKNAPCHSWTEQMSGVSYPPDDVFRNVKTDKYPTQESISLSSASDLKQKTPSQKQAMSVISNGIDNQHSKDFRSVVRSTSTVVHVGSDTSSKSLNLMEFPSENMNESANKNTTSDFKVVTPSSSQSSSFQVLKPSMSRQVSNINTFKNQKHLTDI